MKIPFLTNYIERLVSDKLNATNLSLGKVSEGLQNAYVERHRAFIRKA